MTPSVSCCPLLTIAVRALDKAAHLLTLWHRPSPARATTPTALPLCSFPQFPQPLWKTAATGGRVADFFDYLQVPGNLNKNLSTFLKCYRG